MTAATQPGPGPQPGPVSAPAPAASLPPDREHRLVRITWIGAAVNALLALAKLLAGLLGHSAALVADAAHSLSDLATDAAVLVFVRIAARPPDEDHHFGHGKFETFATFWIALFLFAVALLMNAVSFGTGLLLALEPR